MLIRYPAFEGVTVYIISREAVFARMLELELREAGFTAMRAEAFPQDAKNVGIWIFTASTEALEAEPSRSAHVEFGFSDTGSGRSQAYFQRPFVTVGFVEAVARLALELNGDVPVAVATDTDKRKENDVASSSAGLTYDSNGNVFSYNGEPLILTETELSLLSALYERRGETVTREELLDRVWGREENARKTNLTDVYIRYLREKIDQRFDVRLIVSVRGKGYMLK